jgi:tetratricopeptide (TPR) repeat protein
MTSGSLNENFNNYMKNIKNTVILLFMISFSSLAQESKEVNFGVNPDECKKNLTIMQTYYKQKAYEDAARSYRKCLVECPEASKNTYIIGEKITKNFIKLNKNNKELKSKYVDSLLMVYDLRMKYFPGDKKSQMKILESKGKALAQYRINNSMEEAYLLLDSAVNYTFPKTKSSTAIRFMYVSKIMNKKGKLSCSDVIKNYLTVENIVKDHSDNKNYVRVKQKSLKYADACLDCELLDSLYSMNFEANQNDSNWLDAGIDLLYEKKCNSSEVLVSMMEKRFESSPAAKTAIVLAAYFGNKERNDKALNYFNKAISMQKDSIKLTKYLVKKAKFQNKTGNYSGARSTANKALIIDPKKS